MKPIEFHPLAELLPMMPDDELAELAADIKANGQKEQIVTLDGMILDGRGRYLGCTKAKVKPDTRKYDRLIDGPDPAAFVLSSNVFRRHLTTAQRAIVLAELRGKQRPVGNLAPNGAKLGRPPEAERSLDEAAAQAKVPERTLDRATKVVESAAPAVVAAVKSGDVSLSDAAAVADLPKSEQKAALKAVESGKAKTLKAAAKPQVDKPRQSGKQTADPRSFARWLDLFGKLKRATDDLNRSSPAEKFSREMHSTLNQCHEILSAWRRAVK